MNRIAYPQSGAVVFWNANDSDREKVGRAFESVGLGECVPERVTESAALKAAIVELFGGKDRTVQAHKKKDENGYELVRIDRTKELGGRNGYTVDFCARIVEGRVVTWYGEADRYKLQESFLQHKTILKASAIGQALVAAVEALRGQRLTDRGGIYWMPEDAVDRWETLGLALAGCGVERENAVHMMQTIMTPQTVAAIKEQLIAEVLKDATTITVELTENNLSDEAVDRRKRRAKELRERVDFYASCLGDALQTLKDVLTVAEMSASAAVGIEEHQPGGAFSAVFM